MSVPIAALEDHNLPIGVSEAETNKKLIADDGDLNDLEVVPQVQYLVHIVDLAVLW